MPSSVDASAGTGSTARPSAASGPTWAFRLPADRLTAMTVAPASAAMRVTVVPMPRPPAPQTTTTRPCRPSGSPATGQPALLMRRLVRRIASTLPSASAATYSVPSGPDVMPANGPCGPENGGMPLSGLGVTPGGAPTGRSLAMTVRALVSPAAWRSLLAAAPDAPRVAADPDAPAGIGFTSGTTGAPKGIVHSQ